MRLGFSAVLLSFLLLPACVDPGYEVGGASLHEGSVYFSVQGGLGMESTKGILLLKGALPATLAPRYENPALKDSQLTLDGVQYEILYMEFDASWSDNVPQAYPSRDLQTTNHTRPLSKALVDQIKAGQVFAVLCTAGGSTSGFHYYPRGITIDD